MTLTNVKLLNVKQMPSVSIYQLILNVSVKTDSVSLANHVLTLTNVLGTDNCHKNAKSKNTDGGFECKCNKGYIGDGEVCTDEDECTTGNSKCHKNAKCSNTKGSYTCECGNGFKGNGEKCFDIQTL